MIIDFEKMEKSIIDNFYGGDKSVIANMFVDDKNKIMLGKLESGASIGLHKHVNNCEIIYILNGNGKVLYDGEYEIVLKGKCHYCPKGHSHSLINDSSDDLIFFAVVSEQ